MRRFPQAGTLALAMACFSTGAAAQAPAPAPARAGAILHLQYPASPPERMLALFRALCMRAFPDVDAIERAAVAIDPGISRSESGLPYRYYRHSRHFDLTYDLSGLHKNSLFGRESSCELTLTVGGTLGSAALVARISAALAPRRPPLVRAGTMIWDLAGNGRDRLEYSFQAPERRLRLTRRLAGRR
jgi:hypothetical protein